MAAAAQNDPTEKGPHEAGPSSPRRELTPEDFALLARIPARKPETFDREAIARAAWMVVGLALGLWFIRLLAG